MNIPYILHKLSLIRKNKKFTHADVAKALGCTTKDFRFKESGKRPIITEEWLKISETFDVPLEVFFMNVPASSLKEAKSLIYGYNRLSQKGKVTLKTILNIFLLSQRSFFEDKMKNRGTARTNICKLIPIKKTAKSEIICCKYVYEKVEEKKGLPEHAFFCVHPDRKRRPKNPCLSLNDLPCPITKSLKYFPE